MKFFVGGDLLQRLSDSWAESLVKTMRYDGFCLDWASDVRT